MTTPKSPSSTASHPIRVVSQRTGLKPDLIRAWERRYEAIKPQRTAGRHRYYSDEDIARLLLLRQASSSARSIGQLAQLTDDQLRSVIDEDRRAQIAGSQPRFTPQGPFPPTDNPGVGTDPSLAGENGSPQPTRSIAGPSGNEAAQRPHAENDPKISSAEAPSTAFEEALDAITRLNSEELTARLDEVTLKLGYSRALTEWVGPLLEAVGDRCRTKQLREMHHRFTECELRAFVQTLMRRAPLDSTAPKVIVATPVGHRRELGALLMAAHAAGDGWRAIYLGTQLPADEIAAACVSTKASAVILDLPNSPGDLEQESRLEIEPNAQLEALRHRLGSGISVLVAGSTMANFGLSLHNASSSPTRAGTEMTTIHPVQNPGELRTLLLQLRTRHRARRPASRNPSARPLDPSRANHEPIGRREMPLSAEARKRWGLDPSLLTENGGLKIGTLRSVRRLIHRLNELPSIREGKEPLFYAGQIKATALTHEVLHHLLNSYDRSSSYSLTRLADQQLQSRKVRDLLQRFTELFPQSRSPTNPYGDPTALIHNHLLFRLLALRWINDNTALQETRRLFDDRLLRQESGYDEICKSLEQQLQQLPGWTKGSTLLDELSAAQQAAPNDLPGQMQEWLEQPPPLNDELADRLWLCLDVLHEERTPR